MASAYLSLAKSTPTNAKKFTVSVWVKKSGTTSSSGYYIIDSNGAASGSECPVAFDGNQKLRFGEYNSGDVFNFICNAVSRDPNGWMHVVVAGDSTQSTSSDRIKIYQNGELQSGTGSYPSQNHDFGLTKGSSSFNIGRWLSGTSRYFDGQMAHFHFVDGTTYTPTTFGETDATTGIWKPKTDPGISTSNYGNNGFFLKFDNSANMGLDSSGNSNNFTTNGTIIQTKDSPSNVFACLNRLDFDASNTTLTNINNTLTGGNQGVAYNTVRATLGATKGKWYWELKAADNAEIDQIGVSEMKGLSVIGNTGGFTSSINAYGVQLSNGYKVGLGQSGAAYMGGFSANDIMMIALDLDNDKITFGKNGQWADGSGNANQTYANSTAAFTGLTSTNGYTPTQCMRDSAGNNSGTSHYNFGNGYFGTTAVASAENPDDGNGIFEYDPPTGFRSWCTKSINAEEYS